MVFEKVNFDLRLDACDGISPGDIWGKRFLSRRNCDCAPKMRVCLVHSRNSKELLVTGEE